MALKPLRFILLGLVFGTMNFASADESTAEIVGRWNFYEVEFNGERRPPFSDDLILTIDFDQDGVSLLRWTREGEKGFCERKAHYKWDESFLTQEIFWVNPENRIDCGRDPDMRMGSKSKTPVTIGDGEMRMRLKMGDDKLFYLWKRASNVNKSQTQNEKMSKTETPSEG